MEIQNRETIRDFEEKTKLSANQNQISSQVKGEIVPVLPISPSHKIRIENVTASDTANGTVFTASSVKRTFIIGGSISISKDVNATSTSASISCYPVADNGAQKQLLALRYEPLTAGDYLISRDFSFPVEIQKGSAVTWGNTNAVASIDSNYCVYYYEEDDM